MSQLATVAASQTSQVAVINPENRIREAARRALQGTGYRHIAQLECKVSKGVLLLSGSVPSYYLKQVAQEAVLRQKFGCSLENRITVQEHRTCA